MNLTVVLWRVAVLKTSWYSLHFSVVAHRCKEYWNWSINSVPWLIKIFNGVPLLIIPYFHQGPLNDSWPLVSWLVMPLNDFVLKSLSVSVTLALAAIIDFYVCTKFWKGVSRTNSPRLRVVNEVVTSLVCVLMQEPFALNCGQCTEPYLPCAEELGWQGSHSWPLSQSSSDMISAIKDQPSHKFKLLGESSWMALLHSLTRRISKSHVISILCRR